MVRNNEKLDSSVNRRGFLQAALIAGAVAASPARAAFPSPQDEEGAEFEVADPDALVTNVSRAMAVPKTEISMPGRYPGVVAEVRHPEPFVEGRLQEETVAAMLAASMKLLTGAKDERDAWAEFFNPEDRIGLKFNWVGARLIGTTFEMVRSVIAALESIGVPRGNMLMWDHYQTNYTMAGVNEESFPGIGLRYQQYFDGPPKEKRGKGFELLDMEMYYEADHVIPDDQNMLEYTLNGGTRSYFPKFLSEDIDKIICVPVLKHHEVSLVAHAFKNLSYGATSNCIRGHFFIDRYIAETCAFPPIRDKVVLNILDGLRAQYAGGPAPVAKYIWRPGLVMAATDPVSFDSVSLDMIVEKQVETGFISAEEAVELKRKHDFLARAENLGLGVYRSRKIDHRRVDLA